MASGQKTMKQPAEPRFDAGEDEREEGYKDGMHTASVLVDEVLQAVRVDVENADLSPVAATAAKMTIEAISRLLYERKVAL